MLLFKKAFYPAIAEGKKTTTLRYWKSPRVRPGSVHTVPRLGKIRIDSIDPVAPADLTEADARADGFDSLAALRAELAKLYCEQAGMDGKRWFMVRFAFLGPSRPA